MKLVWEMGECTVRDVYEAIRRDRKIAYTTVMTMMKILWEKGYLKRRKEGLAHVYRPAVSRQRVLSRLVRDFVGRVFNGSAQDLMVHLVKERDLTPEELKSLLQKVGKEGP